MHDKYLAAQARIVELREALEAFPERTDSSKFLMDHLYATIKRAELLATPDDSSALDRRLKEERERCAKVCGGMQYDGYVAPEDGNARQFYSDAASDCADAIRSMK